MNVYIDLVNAVLPGIGTMELDAVSLVAISVFIVRHPNKRRKNEIEDNYFQLSVRRCRFNFRNITCVNERKRQKSTNK